MALLYNGGPLCGPFPIFSKYPIFGEFTLTVYPPFIRRYPRQSEATQKTTEVRIMCNTTIQVPQYFFGLPQFALEASIYAMIPSIYVI